jgi:hypothetical protein
MAWETSRYLLSLSTSISIVVANAASNGCVGSVVTTRGKRLLCPLLEDDPAHVTWHHVDRPPPDTSPVGRLPGSIAKAERGCHGKRGAKRLQAATKNYEEQMGSYAPPVPVFIMPHRATDRAPIAQLPTYTKI